MMNLGKKLGFAALVALGSLTTVQAGVLDSYEYDMTMFVDSDASGFFGAQVSDTTSEIVALGQVDYKLDLTSDTNNGTFGFASADANVGAGELNYASAPGVNADISMTYHNAVIDMFGGVGDGVDLTEGGASTDFYFDTVLADLGLSLLVTIEDMSGAIVSSSMINVPQILSLTRTYLSFNEFAGVDLTDVKNVMIAISSSNSADFTLAEVGTVPEPTTVAIFGLGLVGFALSRKKAK